MLRVSLHFSILFILVPLKRSKIGKENWPAKYYTLAYFSCLGAGFIIIELVLIQIFMKLIGFPLYTFSVVIFTLLVAAGMGSWSSAFMGISPYRRWYWPFLGILMYGTGFLLIYPGLFDIFLGSGVLVRSIVAGVVIFPLGFFLGMPFPLGILLIENHSKGAIAWAWGMNGLFTVIGGILSVLISIYFGFSTTLIFSMLIYMLAYLLYSKMHRIDI